MPDHLSQMSAHLSVVHPEDSLEGHTLRFMACDVHLENGLLAANAVPEGLFCLLKLQFAAVFVRKDDFLFIFYQRLFPPYFLLVLVDVVATAHLREYHDSLLLFDPALFDDASQRAFHEVHLVLEVVQTRTHLPALFQGLIRGVLVGNGTLGLIFSFREGRKQFDVAFLLSLWKWRCGD
jgi:hypothetical protein